MEQEKEEDIPSKPASSVSEMSSTSTQDVLSLGDQTLLSISNSPLVLPPLLTLPPLPSIAPLPTIAPIPPPLAPLPPARPPTVRPLNTDENGSPSDSDHDESGPNPTSSLAPEYEISEESRLARERQEKVKQDLLMKRRAYALAVPTNDSAVRARLRRLGEPITLFGEREMERRDRLRMIMVKLDADGQLDMLLKAHEDEETAVSSAAAEDADAQGPQQYPFYTEGSEALSKSRVDIAKYSIARASLRLQRAKRRRDDPDEDFDAEMDWALRQASDLTLDSSEIGDDRPLTGCSFSHDGKLLATCSVSGIAKLWSMPQVSKLVPLRGHTDRATDIAFSPVSNHLATASADRTAILWNSEGTILKKFEGHLDRLARVSFHPSGKYLGTTSFDKTWRLWDIDTGTELLLQEGHSRSIYGISFHRDGSLAASCGLDALSRVWDLRTGRSILALEGHVKPVFGIDFSPNGYHLATGGEDNTCRIWDLRKKKSLYIIPAHSNLISQVKFEPQEGYYLATASYDTTVKVWSGRDFKPIKTLSGHEAKVTSLDIGGDGQSIATVAYDRTIKLWSTDSNAKDKAMDVD